MGGGEGGDHAGGAAADHDDVVLLSSHVEHVIELPGRPTTVPVDETRGLHECLSVEVRDELAAELAQAERSKVPITPLTDGMPDIDVVDAYEIQLINIRQRVAEGARVIGHKVGLSSEAMQKMMSVDEPDYGHLLDDMEVFEDSPVAAGRFLYPRVEVEVGFILADDLPGAGLHRGRRAGRDGGVRAVDRADRHPDHRLEDQVVRHDRRQRLVGGLGAGRGAGVAQGHRHQATSTRC